jgi:hypothetical protein
VKNLVRSVLVAALIGLHFYTLPAFASYTTGSAQFGSSGQYLSVAGSSDFAVGTGDFTVEWWQYMTETPGDSLPARWPRVWWVDSNFGVSIENAPDPIFYFWLGGARNMATLTNFSSNYKNKWVHFATTRTSSTLRVFANGTLIGSQVNTTNVTNSSTDLGIVTYPPDTACCQFPGRITNFHFVKGTSLYASNFTVSSVPTTAVANTKLLLLNSNSGGLLTDSSPIGRTVTNVGSVTFSALSPAWTNPDTTPPSVTTTAFSAAENQTAIGTLAANESVTWSKVGGVDSATVSIVSGTGVITFSSAPNFEAPSDVGADNVYNVTVRATDTAGNTTNQPITITVTDVVDTSAFNSFALAGGVTTATYRTTIQISANVTVAAKITFRANNNRIPGCINVRTTGTSPNIVAVCNWKPSRRGPLTLTAAATPTGAGISSATAMPLSIRVGNRTGPRA